MAKRVISAILTLKDKDFTSGLRRAGDSTKDFERRMKQGRNEVDRLATTALNGFKNIGMAAGALAATGVAALGTAIGQTVLETDKAFSMLQAQTGISGAGLESLKSTAMDVFKKGYGESITQVTNDMATLKQTLGTVDAKTLESSQILASMNENMDAPSIARALRSMTASFPGATQQKSLDLITKTLQVGGDASGDLLDTFNEYSGVVSSAGISMDSFANIMVNGAKAGARNYDVVADTLKEFNIRAKDGSKTTKEGFSAIGLSASEMGAAIAEGGVKGEKAFYKTFEALAKIEDPVKRNQAGVALFGTKFEDLESKTVEALGKGIDLLGDYDGAAAKAGDALNNNFGAKMSSLWRTVKVDGAAAFKDNGGTELLNDLAKKAGELAPKIKDGVKSATEFGMAIKDNWPTIENVIVGVGTFAGVLATVKLGIYGVTAAQTAWNIAMGLNPVTWVVIGIAALVAAGVLLWKNWDTVRTKTTQLWDKLGAFKPIADALLGPIDEIIGAALTMADNWDSTRSVWDNVWNGMKLVASNTVNDVIGKMNALIVVINKIPGVNVPIIPKVEWGDLKTQYGASSVKITDPMQKQQYGLEKTLAPQTSSKVSSPRTSMPIKNNYGLKVAPSFAVGINSIPNDMVANVHKDEMIIPAQPAKKVRQAGGTIDNIDQLVTNSQAKATSFAVGINSIPTDMVANVHKDEMIIPAQPAKKVRQAGGTIDNIDQLVANSQAKATNIARGPITVIIENLNAKGVTAKEVVEEFVPRLKLELANM